MSATHAMRGLTHHPASNRGGDWPRLLTNLPLMLGALGVGAIVFLALFGSHLAAGDPHAQRSVIFYPDGTFATPPTPPDRYNPLGTDPLGRDQLSRLLWGARLTATIVLTALVGRIFLGVTLGAIAGLKRGGWVDHLVGHVTQAVGGLPQLMLALLLVIVFQGHGATGFVLALALVGWPELASFVRAEVVRATTTPHVQAAHALGATARHVMATHVVRDVSPQLLGLVALEAGAVLLLLAELGFIGAFLQGGVFFSSDSGAPILPPRDRAPEWGQMLAGARQYAFSHQYVALVPGVVVVGSVLAFNLFAEGLRRASDPFSPQRVSPRTLSIVGRTTAVALLTSAIAFAGLSLRASSLTFDDGLDSARRTAAASLPGSELVAGVVRFSSSAHGLSRPERLTYYFRDHDGRILRVSYLGANENAADVKLHTNEDAIDLHRFNVLTSRPAVAWEDALRLAEDRRGAVWRNRGGPYVVRVVLVNDPDRGRPIYLIRYARGTSAGTEVEVHVDATTGQPLFGVF